MNGGARSAPAVDPALTRRSPLIHAALQCAEQQAAPQGPGLLVCMLNTAG